MDTITIDGKEFKVQEEVAELLLMISKERDSLSDAVRFLGSDTKMVGDAYSGEMFEKREVLKIC